MATRNKAATPPDEEGLDKALAHSGLVKCDLVKQVNVDRGVLEKVNQ